MVVKVIHYQGIMHGGNAFHIFQTKEKNENEKRENNCYTTEFATCCNVVFFFFLIIGFPLELLDFRT